MDDLPPAATTIRVRSLLLYAALALIAILLPALPWIANLPNVASTYGKSYQHFELFGLTGTLALLIAAFVEFRKRGFRSFEDLLPSMLFFLFAFHYLTLVTEYSIMSWDYICYENAAHAVLTGANPYEGTGYLYPPLVAQTLALLDRIAVFGVSATGIDAAATLTWDGIFYIYQCSQYILMLVTYCMCYRLCLSCGMKRLPASIAVAVLLIVNNAVFRTVRHNEVNLWVLDLSLVTILFARRRPWLGGLSLALAANIKLYPVLLFAPLLITRRYRAVLWSFLGMIALFLAGTDLGRNIEPWRQFMGLLGAFPKGLAIRDNGVCGIVFNSLEQFGRLLGVSLIKSVFLFRSLVWAVTLGLVGWFVWRGARRERAFRLLGGEGQVGERAGWADLSRLYGHAFDSMALGLMISPRVWEHHFVLAIPVVLWAVVARGAENPWKIGIGWFLMLVVPTFDLYPLSYHRVAGLIILLALTGAFVNRRTNCKWMWEDGIPRTLESP